MFFDFRYIFIFFFIIVYFDLCFRLRDNLISFFPKKIIKDKVHMIYHILFLLIIYMFLFSPEN